MQRVVNTRADALVALAASLFIPDGEVLHIRITGKRLLIPFMERLSEPMPEWICSFGREPMEDY